MKIPFHYQMLSVVLAALMPTLSPNISWGAITAPQDQATMAFTTNAIDPSLISTQFLVLPPIGSVNTQPGNGRKSDFVAIVGVVVVFIMLGGVIIIGCQADKKLNPKPPKKPPQTNAPPHAVTSESTAGGATTSSANSDDNIYAAWVVLGPGQSTAFNGDSTPNLSSGSSSYTCVSETAFSPANISSFSNIPASKFINWEEFVGIINEYGINATGVSNYGLNGMPSTNAMNVRMEGNVLTIGDNPKNAFTVERSTQSASSGGWQSIISVNLPDGMTPTFIEGGSSDSAAKYRTVRHVP